LTITLFPYYLPKMPSSPPNAPIPPEEDTAPKTPEVPAVLTVVGVFGFLWYFIWSFGAASLSYAKYGSVGWAILDFFFAGLYYPYYALVLNTPTATMTGGRRRRFM
jgi:hypothetical protein